MKLGDVRPRTVLRPIVLGGVAALLAAGPRTSTAACSPAVMVEGAAEIAQRVSLILRQHGIGAGPSACGDPSIRAVLTKNAAMTKFTLHIVDGFGRTSDRQVANPDDAASLIESWATAEDADVLLPPFQPALPAIAEARSPEPLPEQLRWHTLAAGEISRAGDGSTWYGGFATFCRTVGPVCVGGRARAARSAAMALFTGALNRTAVDGSVIAATGLSRGRLTVAPIVDLGAQWTHSSLAGVPVTFSADDVGLKAGAAIAVAWAFARRWSVVGEAGGGADFVLGGRGNPRPSFFTLAGAIPSDPIPTPPIADLHLAIGIELAP